MWEPVKGGHSDAEIHRRDGVYRKVHPEVRTEAAKLVWLRSHGIPAPEVLDVGEGWLLMTELVGRSAAEPWPRDMRDRVMDTMAELARAVHALPVNECLYDRRLAITLPMARAAVGEGRVRLDKLEESHAGRSAEDLLAELEATVPDTEDVVVTHGDLSLPNVILDPESVALVGIIDVGRVGLADRYTDLAIAVRSIGNRRLNPQYGQEHAECFLSRYGIEPDPDRIRFYRLLDEFP